MPGGRFAATGRRAPYSGPNLPRSVQGLGLPPRPGGGGGMLNPGLAPHLPSLAPQRPRQISPLQRMTAALQTALDADNPNRALAHLLKNPNEYQIAQSALQRVLSGRADRQQAIAQLAGNIRQGTRIDQPAPPGSDAGADYMALGEKYGLSGEEAQTLHELVQTNKGGPQGPALLGSVLGKAANAIPAAEAGFDKGVLEYYQDRSSHNLSPWSYINSLPMAMGKGFTEVPGAVKEGYDYTALLREKNNPNSLLYRYSLPIGIGMDFLLDPTIYLSGGMTAETKVTASVMTFDRFMEASSRAEKLIGAGKAINPETKLPYTMHDLDTVIGQEMTNMGAPWSVMDGHLENLRMRHVAKGIRESQLEARRAARRGARGRKAQVGAILAPGKVGGGAGLRFAGMEIPGTPRLGAFVAKHLRTAQAKRFERMGGQEGEANVIAKLVPDSALRHEVGDLSRMVGAGHRLQMQKVINAGPLTGEANLEKVLTSKMYQEVKHEEIIPGRPSTTGPETETHFTHTGALMHNSELQVGDEVHSIYDEHNNLIGSLTWGPEPYTANAIEAHTAYIRPDMRNVKNYQKLIEPLLEEARAGTEVNTFVLNHQLGNILERIAERENLNINVHYLHSSLAERANAERVLETGRVRKRGRQTPVEVPTSHLPELATPDEVREWSEQSLLGTVDKVAPYEVRENVHHMSESKMTPVQKTFRNLYDNRINLFRHQALEAGWERGKVEDLIKYYGDEYPDPVDALWRMQTHLDINIGSKAWIKTALENPALARPLKKTRVNEKGTIIYRADPPAGWSIFRHNNKDYSVRTPVSYGLEAMKNDAFLQYMHNQGPYAFTNIQQWWKIMATMPNPSFHTMNFLGAVWNNQLMGMGSSTNYLRVYWNYLHKSRLEEAARLDRPTLRAPIRAMRGKAPKSTPETKQALKEKKALELRGGGGRSSAVFAETEEQLGIPPSILTGPKGIMKRLVTPGPELRARYAKTPPQLGEKEVKIRKATVRFKSANRALAARRARQALAIGLAPFTGGQSMALMLPEAAKIARTRVGGPIENLVRMTPFIVKSHDPQLLHTLRQLDDAFGPPRAIGYKYENFTNKEKELAQDIAAAMVRRYQFDYADLTDFERRFAKSIFPFYTYYRKNFVLQAQEVIKRPRNFLAAKALANYIDEQSGDIGPDMHAILPGYFQNLMAFQVPIPNSIRGKLGLPKDDPIYINPKLPVASLNLFPPLWGVVNQDGQITPQNAGAILAPVFGSIGPHAGGVPGSKMMMEYISGWEFGLNRPVDYQRASSNDWRNSTADAPFYAKYMPKPLRHALGIAKDKRGRYVMSASNRYLIDQMASPFMTNWGSSIAPDAATGAEEGHATANRIAWLTGFRLMPADMHKLSKNYGYATKNMLEARQSELRAKGLELTDEDEETLDIAKDLVDIAKEIDDERYFQLYGEERGGG